jgi:dynactin complex subunit
MKLSDSTQISLPARNLLAILAAVAIGTMSYFTIVERLNSIETTLQLMEKDLEAANTFIDGVPKGDMVSPQVQELYMLVEYLAESTEKLKEQMEAEIPMILKNDMIIQFHEERLIDLEERKNGNH